MPSASEIALVKEPFHEHALWLRKHLVYCRVIPSISADHVPIDNLNDSLQIPQALRDALSQMGYSSLFSHQLEG